MRRVLDAVSVAFLYYVTGKAGVLTAIPPGLATAVWPPSGVAFAAVLLFGRRAAPGIWLGSFVLNTGILSSGGASWRLAGLVAAVVATGSTLQALVGAKLIERVTGSRHPFDDVRSVLKFVAVAVVSCAIAPVFATAALAAGRLIAADAVPWTWMTWWLGDLVGVLVVAPLPLVLRRRGKLDGRPERVPEAALLLLSSLATCHVLFGNALSLGPLHYPLEFLVLPFVLWAAFRFGPSGTMLTVLVVAVAAISGTVRGFGPFSAGTVNESLLLLQAYVAVVALVGLTLSTLLLERARGEERLRRLADELRGVNAELEQFAYMATHDLQEPLRTISCYLGLLAQRCRGKIDDKAEGLIRSTIEASVRMKVLIDDILRYSKLGSSAPALHPVDGGALVAQAVANLELAISESGARIHCGPLPRLAGDAQQLVQLFQNLLSNAIKYRRADQPVRVDVRCDSGPDEWSFSVTDNGIGVEAESRENIFQAFHRLHGRAQYPGTGIGLAICKKIVENHGGRIWVEAAAGTGSVFRFTLRRSS